MRARAGGALRLTPEARGVLCAGVCGASVSVEAASASLSASAASASFFPFFLGVFTLAASAAGAAPLDPAATIFFSCLLGQSFGASSISLRSTVEREDRPASGAGIAMATSPMTGGGGAGPVSSPITPPRMTF